MTDHEAKPADRAVKVFEFASKDEKADGLDLEKALGRVNSNGNPVSQSAARTPDRHHSRD